MIPGNAPDLGSPVTSNDLTLTVTPSTLHSGAGLRVDMHGHVSGLVAVTVTRTTDGVVEIVRGMDAVVTPAGYLTGFDHEPDRGVTVTYRAFTDTYSSGEVDVEIADGPAVLKSLDDPRMSVHIGVDAYPDWADGIDDNVLRIVGRADPIVTDDGVRWTGEGTVQGVTRDRQTRAALKALLDTGGGPFLLAPSAVSDEPDVFVHVRASKRARWSQQSSQPRRNHELPIVEVTRPGTTGSTVAVPGHTYADLTGTWADQTAPSYFTLGDT